MTLHPKLSLTVEAPHWPTTGYVFLHCSFSLFIWREDFLFTKQQYSLWFKRVETRKVTLWSMCRLFIWLLACIYPSLGGGASWCTHSSFSSLCVKLLQILIWILPNMPLKVAVTDYSGSPQFESSTPNLWRAFIIFSLSLLHVQLFPPHLFLLLNSLLILSDRSLLNTKLL